VAESFLLTVWTPGEALLEVDGVLEICALLTDGSIGIFPGHAPLLAETVAGPLRYVDETGEHRVDLEIGILQIERHKVAVYTSGFVGQTSHEGDEASKSEAEQFDRLTWELMDILAVGPSGSFGGTAVQVGNSEPDEWVGT
jgi:F0F1-type ATP synthase epsilon subunit